MVSERERERLAAGRQQRRRRQRQCTQTAQADRADSVMSRGAQHLSVNVSFDSTTRIKSSGSDETLAARLGCSGGMVHVVQGQDWTQQERGASGEGPDLNRAARLRLAAQSGSARPACCSMRAKALTSTSLLLNPHSRHAEVDVQRRSQDAMMQRA